MKLGQQGSSSFFNLVTSLNAKNDHVLLSKTTANRKIQQQQQQQTNATALSIQPVESNLPLTIVNMNPSNYSMKTLINNLPDQYFMYLCLNCRLFFASNTTFSHNCWNLNDTSMKQTNNSKAPTTNATTTTNPTLANSNQPQPANVNPTTNSNSSNYFSPIYLKFNITKLLAGMNAKPAIVSNNDSTNDEPVTKKLKTANNILKNSNPTVAHNHVNTNNVDTSNPNSQPIDVESIQAK